MVSNETCQLMAEFSKSWTIRPVELLVFLANMTALAANLVSLWLLLRTACFHTHLRALLCSSGAANIIYSGAKAAQQLFNGLRFLFSTGQQEQGCDQMDNLWSNCRFILFSVGLAGIGLIFAFVCMAIERFWATLRYRTYEKSQSIVFICLCVATPWALSLGIVPLAQPSDRLFAYCSSFAYTGESADIKRLMVTVLPIRKAMEGLLLTALFAVLSYNRQLKRREHNGKTFFSPSQRLSSWYQMVENVRTSGAVAKVLLALMVGTSISEGVFVLVKLDLLVPSLDEATKTGLVELATLGFALYALAFSLIIIGASSQMKIKAKAVLPMWMGQMMFPEGKETVEGRGMQNETAKHFAELDKAWA